LQRLPRRVIERTAYAGALGGLRQMIPDRRRRGENEGIRNCRLMLDMNAGA